MRQFFSKTLFLDSIFDPLFFHTLCPIFEELSFLVEFKKKFSGKFHNRTDINMCNAMHSYSYLIFAKKKDICFVIFSLKQDIHDYGSDLFVPKQ